MSALSDALNEANTNRWSSRDIQRRSGDRINHATVAKYLNGSHGKPTEQVLQIFSEVFGLPLPRLRQLAGLPTGERAPYEPPAEADRLSTRQRKAVNELIRLLVDTTEEAGGEHDQRSAPMNTAADDDYDYLVSLPGGGVYVIEARSGPTFAGQTSGDVETRLRQHLGKDAKIHIVEHVPSDVPRTDWDQLLALAAAGEDENLSEEAPTVPLKRVARRSSGPKK